MNNPLAIAILSLAALSLRLHAQDSMQMPAHKDAPDTHAAGVDARGDHAMGFSHETTKHHFEPLKDGGIIEVEANDAADTATRDQIRMHLTHIAAMFSANNFDVPMFIHDRVPPGVPVMKQKHYAITYTFQPTERGGLVRITTNDPDALAAIHEFLAFQIVDHRTSDNSSIKPSS